MSDSHAPFAKHGASRPPDFITHAPDGLPGGPTPPSPGRKASLAVALVALGAGATALGVSYEGSRRAQACRDAGRPPETCSTSYGGYSSSHWYFSSGTSGSGSSSAGQASSSGHATFGGFGATGAAHAGGGS